MTAKMKKVLGVALLMGALVSALALVGCGGGGSAEAGGSDGVTGTWEMSGMEVSGAEMPQDYVDEYIATLGGDNLKLTFMDGGKVETNFAGATAEGAYTYDNGKGSIDEGGQSLSFEVADGKLKLDYEGVSIVFSKK